MSTYLQSYRDGTVSVANGSTAVTGTLTVWNANVQPGDRLVIGTTEAEVASVESNTALTLVAGWSGSSVSGSAYKINRWSKGWSAAGTTALLLSQYVSNMPTFIPTSGVPSNSIGSDGNIAVDATAAIFYTKSGGVWDGGTSMAGTVGPAGELTRSGDQTGGMMQWASNATAKEAPNTRIDSVGKIGLNITSAPTGRLHVGGAVACAMEPNAFGMSSSYVALVAGDLLSATAGANGGLYAVGRYDRTKEPFTAMSGWDTGTTRTIYIGGGGWGVPDATLLQFYTAAAYNETNAAGVLRLIVASDGNVRPGADNAQSFGSSSARWAAIYAANGTIQTSDARDKIEAGRLDGRAGGMVDAISPVLFRWKVGGNDVAPSATQTETLEDGRVVPKMVVTPKPGNRVQAGFFAQDVKAAMDAAGVDFGAWGLDDKDDPESRQWVRPDQLIPVLWQALRETRAELAALRAEISGN